MAHSLLVACLLVAHHWPEAHALPVIDENAEEEVFTPDDLENEISPLPQPSPDTRPQADKTTTSKSEKIFDWDKHQNETEVKHPFGEKGLIKITKDRTYYYRVKESERSRALSIQAGPFDPTNLSNPDREGQIGASFADNYDQASAPAILAEYEWQLWRSGLGHVGVRLGSGLYITQGNGHFVGGTNQSLTPREVFTFLAMPNSLGAVYRLRFWERQLLVPYAQGGGVVFTFAEIRDDNKGPKFGAAPAFYGAAGLAFNLSYFDYMSRLRLDAEYGVNAAYLTAEYRRIQALSSRFDFTGDLINAGFMVEY